MAQESAKKAERLRRQAGQAGGPRAGPAHRHHPLLEHRGRRACLRGLRSGRGVEGRHGLARAPLRGQRRRHRHRPAHRPRVAARRRPLRRGDVEGGAAPVARRLAAGDGLDDASAAGDWRLPNIKELLSIVDYGSAAPALPAGNPFRHVRNAIYWTSSSLASAPGPGLDGDPRHTPAVLEPQGQRLPHVAGARRGTDRAHRADRVLGRDGARDGPARAAARTATCRPASPRPTRASATRATAPSSTASPVWCG